MDYSFSILRKNLCTISFALEWKFCELCSNKAYLKENIQCVRASCPAFHLDFPRGHFCFQILNTLSKAWLDNTDPCFLGEPNIERCSWPVRRQVWALTGTCQLVWCAGVQPCQPKWDRNIRTECSQRFWPTRRTSCYYSKCSTFCSSMIGKNFLPRTKPGQWRGHREQN